MRSLRTTRVGPGAAVALLLGVASMPSHAQHAPGPADFQARAAYERAYRMTMSATCLPSRSRTVGSSCALGRSGSRTQVFVIPSASGYGGSLPLGGNPQYTYDLYGALRGSADAISAQSRHLVALQEAQLLAERLHAQQGENRRSAFEHYLYVREHTPTLEQTRTEERAQRRERARNDPPTTEIFSAGALNELLADLQQAPRAGVKDLPLDAALVRRVNFTAARDGSNVGLLRSGGKLHWPVLLAEQGFQAPRDRLTVLVRASVEQLQSGVRPDRATLLQMDEDLETLNRKLRGLVAEAPAPRFIEAKRFLNQLGDALKAIQRPDAVRFFNGSYDFKGQTVHELVNFMTEQGLCFAPATDGDEPAYRAVHQVFAVYSLATHVRLLESGVAQR